MTCMKQEFCIHEKYCQRHIGQNFDSCILFSRNSKPMTNEEWLKSMNTEELADNLWLLVKAGILLSWRMGYEVNDDREATLLWLKDEHR